MKTKERVMPHAKVQFYTSGTEKTCAFHFEECGLLETNSMGFVLHIHHHETGVPLGNKEIPFGEWVAEINIDGENAPITVDPDYTHPSEG